MTSTPRYTTEAVTIDNDLTDIRIFIDGKTWHLWGRNGGQREQDLAAKVPASSLPVLMGSGLGHCLKTLLSQGRQVAVVDKESPITNITSLKKEYGNHPDILWVEDETPTAALDRLNQWQANNEGKHFSPVVLPLYLRLDRGYYAALANTLKASQTTDFWSQARYPKFQNTSPRILFLDSNYFLCGEIKAAMHQLDVEHRTIMLDGGETGSQTFVEELLKCVVDFRPDFVLTVNHFGLDREGKLASLLADLGLPLASWFVDNPHLILHQYAHPGTDNTVIFTYDAGNIDQMQSRGFANTHYLPLATDPNRFKPALGQCAEGWKSDVSFVGNSMVSQVENSLNDADLPDWMKREYEEVAALFGKSGQSNVADFLKTNHPAWHEGLENLSTPENRLALESLLTWEATRQYRHSCVRGIMNFTPLIVGDDGWKELIETGYWRHQQYIDYYGELPKFYPCSTINFNCTSRQMIGAVNQRVFDVPACEAFVLTDYREQMEDLFDLEKEAVAYHSPDEIPALIDHFLKDHGARKSIVRAARKRILAHHTYEIRLDRLLSVMRQTFG